MVRLNSTSCLSRLFIVSVFIGLSCSKDNPTPNIPGDFSGYVNRFVEAGLVRNVKVETVGLIIEFVDQATIGPYCGYSVGGKHVKISNSPGCWSNQTETNKEILIFHELGHALLGRSHYNFEYNNGKWASMMHSGNQFNLYTSNDPNNMRSYFWDELFNANTPLPITILPKSNSKINLSDSIPVSHNWLFVKTSSTLNHISGVSGTVYTSSGHSLSIQAPDGPVGSGSSYWYLPVNPNLIPASATELELKVKVKLDHVNSGGASIVLRGTMGSDMGVYKTTQGVIDLSGTKDFSEYSLVIPYFPEKINSLNIFLEFFGNSTGTVYFDDVTLVNRY